MTVADLSRLSPVFDWKRYIVALGAPKFDTLNVTAPDFVKGFNDVVALTALDDIKTYLGWRLLSAAASMLPKAFVDEQFDFYGKTLTGATELRPRWKRCVRFTDSDLGEALGKSYVEEAFGGQSKQRVLNMVHAIEQALQGDIQELSWMTPETKKQALVKLAAVENKIGYPDKWRDYSALKIIRGDALGNSLRANEFENHRQLAKIGKPVDRAEWSMSPPTVNAYYNPQENNINFPAGILQPPFFDMRADDAVNLGGIGAVIGHELTHGFDDQGRQFDAQGNLRDWWTAKDATAFESRAQCFVDQYSKLRADRRRSPEWQAHPRRKHGGQWRRSPRAARSKGNCRLERSAGRGFHSGAAILCQLRADLVRQRQAGGAAAARPGRSALAGPVPGQRRALQYARVPKGVQLQARLADGESEAVPGVVRRGFSACESIPPARGRDSWSGPAGRIRHDGSPSSAPRRAAGGTPAGCTCA